MGGLSLVEVPLVAFESCVQNKLLVKVFMCQGKESALILASAWEVEGYPIKHTTLN